MAKVVKAVGIAVKSDDPELGKKVEAAMLRAIELAQEEGITDPLVIRERISQARREAVEG